MRLAFFMSVALLVWVASGIASQDSESPETIQSQSPSTFTVQIAEFESQPYRKPVFIRGRTEADREVIVSAEIDGKLIKRVAKEGAFVEKGGVLCQLDPEDRPEILAQAKAAVTKAELDYQGALKLKDGGYQSAAQIASAKSQLALAQSALKSSELALQRLSIRAPFSGYVEKYAVDPGAFMQRGSACATLIDLNPLVVSGKVSEKEMLAMQVGNAAEVRFAGQQKVDGTVRYISRAADQTTRTFLVEVEIENSENRWAQGMSAEVVVFTPQKEAHLISPSLLSLRKDGSLGVKIAQAQGERYRVDVLPVEIYGDDNKGVWVGGLPERVTLITVGGEYVAVGQVVKATKAGIQTKNDAQAAASSPQGDRS